MTKGNRRRGALRSARRSTAPRRPAVHDTSGAAPEEPLLAVEVRRPLEPVRLREAEVSAQRLLHRVHEALDPARRKAVLPPEADDLDAPAVAVDPRLDPADEAVAEQDRQHVPAPTALGGWVEELPDVLEVEQRLKKGPVPDDRIERRQKRDGGRRLRRRSEQVDLLGQHQALAAHALDIDRYELAGLDELVPEDRPPGMIRPLRSRLRVAQAAEDVAAAAETQEPVRPIPREHLVAELLAERHLVREDVGRHQALEQVVVAAVAVASREPEHAGDGVCLEDGAHDVRRRPEPVRRGTALTFEVEC